MKQAYRFDQLFKEGLLSEASYQKVKENEANGLLSVHWELKTLLYLGVLLFSTGLGILVYQNIDTIGHQVILICIGLVSAACFFYCTKMKLPFSTGKVQAPNAFFDYVLLLGCCSLLTFIAYFQYQYNVFGNRYGLATFFPMLILFLSAYYFDHLGILSMAIVNLGAWLGIAVTPMQLLATNDFNSAGIIFTGLGLGLVLLLLAWISKQKAIKPHFEFTYTNFGVHLSLVCSLAAMFTFGGSYLAWFILFAAMVFYFYRQAMRDRSFYFILVVALYAFIGLAYVVVKLLSRWGGGIGSVYLGFLYFIASGIGLVVFLIRTNKKLKHL